MSDFLNDRRSGLENAFFAEQDAVLRRRLAEGDVKTTGLDALSAASGIRDKAVLEKLSALNITGTSLTALSLVPMVLVAWADGGVEQKERDAILSGAEKAGLDADNAGYPLLKAWLSHKPPAELASTWKLYVAALSETLDNDAKHRLKDELLGRAKTVAEAAGGFFGLTQGVSASEKAVLADLEQAFGI
jgi:hypothetical protein